MKAVLVFCEGNHDITFISRSLGQVANAHWIGKTVGELPSPLGPIPDPNNPIKPKMVGIIAKKYLNRTIDTLGLQAVAHAALPTFEVIVRIEDTYYVLIRCNGDCGVQEAIKLLGDIKSLLNPIFPTDIKEIAAAFIFDADDSLEARELSFASDYGDLFPNGEVAPNHGSWANGSTCIGLYIFHDYVNKKGTLEEIIAPLVADEWRDRWEAAGKYLNEHANRNDPILIKNSEFLKAQINVTGQFVCPGDPMSTVIRKNRKNNSGLSDKHFKGIESKRVVNFLINVPW